MILGLILVSFISILSGIITRKMNSIFFRLVIVAICSVISASLIYWVPAWQYSVGDEYLSRQHLYIQSWFVFGFTAGSTTVIISMIMNKK